MHPIPSPGRCATETVLLLLSKPVYRWTFILGKITGIGLAVTLFTLLCNLATITSVYMATDQFRFDMTIFYSYFGGAGGGLPHRNALQLLARQFISGRAISESAMVLIPILAICCIVSQEEPTVSLKDLCCALVLLNFAVVAMSTISVVFATRLDAVANLSICTLVFFLGLVSSYLFQRETDSAFLNAVFSFF